VTTWPSKDPDEVLDYDNNWGDDADLGLGRLAVGETIVTSTFSVIEGTVVVDSSSIVGDKTFVWLSGGAVGERCKILNRITTSAGRTYDHTVVLRIRSH
jgi:hypothetical protein